MSHDLICMLIKCGSPRCACSKYWSCHAEVHIAMSVSWAIEERKGRVYKEAAIRPKRGKRSCIGIISATSSTVCDVEIRMGIRKAHRKRPVIFPLVVCPNCAPFDGVFVTIGHGIAL